jgi:hypothetical protein
MPHRSYSTEPFGLAFSLLRIERSKTKKPRWFPGGAEEERREGELLSG